jgi:hypothetical protein
LIRVAVRGLMGVVQRYYNAVCIALASAAYIAQVSA